MQSKRWEILSLEMLWKEFHQVLHGTRWNFWSCTELKNFWYLNITKNVSDSKATYSSWYHLKTFSILWCQMCVMYSSRLSPMSFENADFSAISCKCLNKEVQFECNYVCSFSPGKLHIMVFKQQKSAFKTWAGYACSGKLTHKLLLERKMISQFISIFMLFGTVLICAAKEKSLNCFWLVYVQNLKMYTWQGWRRGFLTV